LSTPGTLVDNELLDSGRYAALLDEIRATLACQTAEPATFRRLAAALSAPALGLLLFLGGAASVGCNSTGLHGPAPMQDAGPPDIVDTSTTQPASEPDASIPLDLADAPRAPDIADAARSEASPDLPSIKITIPDAPPARDAGTATDAVAVSQTDGAAVTIQDIMDSCNIPDQTQQQILTCLAKLGDSWAGLAEEFAGANCSLVSSDLGCLAQSTMCGRPYEITYPSDPNMPWICRPIIIYAGVRFV
jgi:hypothetical protein